jgi:Flp pilus assembly protein TadG
VNGHGHSADRARDQRARPTRDRGQAAVEFAIALPLIVIVVLGIVQVVIVARDQVAVEVAAREAARAAAVAGAPSSAAQGAALAATSLRPLRVATASTATRVTVTVSYSSPTDVALIGPAIGDVVVSASVTMAREPP